MTKGDVSQVIIALPRKAYLELENILDLLSDETVDVRVVPDLAQFVRLRMEIDDFDGMPIITLNDTPLGGYNILIKME